LKIAYNGATFFSTVEYVLILTKMGWGNILGDFFTNSSGHPDWHIASRTQEKLLKLFFQSLKNIGENVFY
jgi:hypothetical protein